MQVKNKQSQKQKVKWVNPLKDRTRVVPFVVPDSQQRKNALGSLVGQKWRIRKSLEAIINSFDPIKKPQPGDNLYEFQQDGQDYPLFSSIYRNHIDLQNQFIYIIAFKCNLSKNIIKKIKKNTKDFFYGAKVKILDFPQNIDLNQFDVIQTQKGQKYYNAAQINTYFTKLLPKNTFSVAIITSLLIYNGDRVQKNIHQLWVFGLGSIKDRTSIISYEQIIKKGYGCEKQLGSDQNQFNIDMLSKVVNHQLCHTFGMKHCIYYTCLMNGSNGYNEACQKVAHICPVCLRKLQSELKFQFYLRYQVLGDLKSLQLAQKIRKNLNQIK